MRGFFFCELLEGALLFALQKSRLFPVWDKRHNMIFCHKRASVWPSIRLQTVVVFEIFWEAWEMVHVLEAVHGGHDLVSLSLIDIHDAVLDEEFHRICIAREYVLAETPVREILDEFVPRVARAGGAASRIPSGGGSLFFQSAWRVLGEYHKVAEGRLSGDGAALEACHKQPDMR